jgi:hypothetical protein
MRWWQKVNEGRAKSALRAELGQEALRARFPVWCYGVAGAWPEQREFCNGCVRHNTEMSKETWLPCVCPKTHHLSNLVIVLENNIKTTTMKLTALAF